MYVPAAFHENDIATLHGMMQSTGLANLVTVTHKGLVSTPLPLLLAPEEGEFGTLYGHLARANTQWSLQPTMDAMAIFMGPDAYISPSWYPSKQEHHKVVPTWNYLAVHAYGPVEFFDDKDKLLSIVTQLTNLHERTKPLPWAVSDAPAAYIDSMLKAIVGLRLPISRIDGKRKMSQNRTVQDRQAVATALSQSVLASDREAAKHIPVEGTIE